MVGGGALDVLDGQVVFNSLEEEVEAEACNAEEFQLVHGTGLELPVRSTCVVLQNEVSVLYETAIEVVQMKRKSVEMILLNIGVPESMGGGTVEVDLGSAK
ncbi:uncharacterized protein MONOS_9326 [Monocercomonoides exilis]|uniref:uncharacterized protein n=1 Tax=Monocercomonoides exilis TaxID=2049356 RepID=UPI003559C47F|nr:hypothetical protein MONOS_9326 [Monocercomonoides exilis]|eukprot:MONOS_9326.1-p1 / transcript=MONOS_9326.1 / gene=MONOS_9326 / organism=Monocercomonoides_exilis_PA203 / gene_product=unspecified product / transcript_product=unspecified product / location=Mono_scaffold00381:14559-14861(+) / protein_length=101 / sequence_SO=supercontig / SO=protein_coding / is_pseudo=false